MSFHLSYGSAYQELHGQTLQAATTCMIAGMYVFNLSHCINILSGSVHNGSQAHADQVVCDVICLVVLLGKQQENLEIASRLCSAQ